MATLAEPLSGTPTSSPKMMMKNESTYLDHHFEMSVKPKVPLNISDEPIKTLSFTTTPNPKASRPMSGSRIFGATLITISHLISLYALYDAFFNLEIVNGLKWILAALLGHYIFGVTGITAGAHRLWAHRSYTATVPVRIFLMFMNSVSNQGSILHWAIDHRIHHIHVDTDADPHNINRGFFFAHMGWLFSPRTDAYAEAKKYIDISDLQADPVVAWQTRNYSWFGPLCCYVLPTLAASWWCGDALRGFLYLGNLRWVMSLQFTWCINSVSHVFGTRPYSPHQKATDNWFTSIFAGGEGWHNYHHTFAWDYAACEQTSLFSFNDPSGIDWRFNAARFVIDFFALLGGVSNRKIARNQNRAPLQNPTEVTKPTPLMRDELIAKKIN